jgi:hypothetical protein
MQFNLPLHNNLEVRRRQKINPKRIIIMNNPKPKLHRLLLKRNHNGNLKFPCLICGDDHYTRDCPHRDEVAKLFKGNSQPAVLTQPFPQQQSMVAQTPPTGGSSSHPPNDEASTSAHIYMFNGIDLTTRTMTYDTPAKPDKEKVTNGSLPDPCLR